MKQNSTIPLWGGIISIIALSVNLSGCEDLGDINEKPKREGNAFEYKPKPSKINAEFKINMDDIEDVINLQFANPIKDTLKGTIGNSYKLTTKDPFFHPNKWIYTRNPFYDPKKWIKICAFGGCIKTKNPSYNPIKEIKSKDPLYHPNEWMVTYIQAKVDYEAEYEIGLYDDIYFQPASEKKLKIQIPIIGKAKGKFKGDIAQLASLSKKIEAKALYSSLIGVEFDNNWCPIVSIEDDLEWIQGPKIELVSGFWFDLNSIFNLATGIKKLSDTSLLAFDQATLCDNIKPEIKKLTIPTVISLEDSIPTNTSNEIAEAYSGFNLLINPVEIYKPKINYIDKDMNLKVGTEIMLSVTDEDIAPQSIALPALTENDNIDNIIDINLPIKITYDRIEKILNASKGEVQSAINNAISGKNTDVKTVTIDSFDVYPANDRIAIGVSFDIDTGSMLSTDGIMYLTSKPVITEDKKFHLEDVSINADFSNTGYDIALTLLKSIIESKIEEMSTYDLSEQINTGTKLVTSQIEEALKTNNRIELKLLEPSLDFSDDFHNTDKSLIKNIGLKTGMAIRIRPL